MESLLQVDIGELIARFGYLGLFTLIFFECAGIPLPGELALVSASIFAGTSSHLQIEFVIASAAAAAILGDNLRQIAVSQRKPVPFAVSFLLVRVQRNRGDRLGLKAEGAYLLLQVFGLHIIGATGFLGRVALAHVWHFHQRDFQRALCERHKRDEKQEDFHSPAAN